MSRTALFFLCNAAITLTVVAAERPLVNENLPPGVHSIRRFSASNAIESDHETVLQPTLGPENSTAESSEGLTSPFPRIPGSGDAKQSIGPPMVPPTGTTDGNEHQNSQQMQDEPHANVALPRLILDGYQPMAESLSSQFRNDSCSNFCCVCDEQYRMLTVYAGLGVMTRSQADNRQLVLNPARPNDRLNAADFDFGAQGGVEAGVIAHGEVADLGFRFLGVSDISDSQRVTFNNANPGTANVQYDSSMRSFEANLRYRYGGGARWWTLLTGVRYINVEESLSGRFSSTGLAANDNATIDVDNHLYGFQIGLDETLFGDSCYSIDCYGRLGLYGNDSSTTSRRQSAAPGAPLFSGGGSDGQSSFVGELGVKGTYRLNDAWNLYGHYQVLFIEDVTLASEQIGTQHTAHGDVTFHGAVFGLEYIY